MPRPLQPQEERLLVLAPTGRDGRLLLETLSGANIPAELCGSIDALCLQANAGAGALFIAEEALTPEGIATLQKMVEQQPPWSDVPVIISTGQGATTQARVRSLDSIGASGNVIILERPVRILTMVVTIQSALRARRRQYQMRNLTQQIVEERNKAVEARAAAESANRTKDEFLAMLGHELRNPLAPILTALQLMRLRDGAETKERAIIERQARHMAALVDDLLDVSRITQSKIELKREVLELGELLSKAVETAAPLLEKRHHELTVRVAARTHYVDGDPDRLVQVFSNILTNAAKYTEEGGRISVEATVENEQIFVRIADTGRGISPQMLPHIFELFSQEHQNLDRSQGGLGLGLAIVKSLVEMHGGIVSVKSAGNGQGSEFCVRLPAAPRPKDAIRVPVSGPYSTPQRPAAGAEPRRLSILVVDDNKDAAEMLAEAFEMLGYQPHVAFDGPQALALARTADPPAAAFLDIGLPVMDGYELARRLRELPGWSALPLFAVTGYGQDRDRRQSRDAGFDQHLVKPIGLAALQKALQSVVR